MSELNRLSASEFKSSEKLPVMIVLDDVRSAYNVGSIFRTADAFRISGIYLCGISAMPPHKDITKTALGATGTVEWKFYPDATETVSQLKKDGWTIWAVEQTDESVSLDQFFPKKDMKIALVFGHEVFGVKDEILDMVDGSIEIPQFGMKHSFNVAISAGIVLWDIVCKINR